MADPVGMTASVITITGCICLAVQWLFTWGRFFYYEAEINVIALQDLLDGITVLLTEVSSRKSTSPNPNLDANIVRARRVVDQLNHVLHQTLGAQNGSRFWRRLLWLRHSSNVEKLKFRLRTLKDDILDMNHVDLVKETEQTLLNINNDRRHGITMLQDVASDFDRKLESLRTDLSPNNQLVSLDVHSVMKMLGLAPETRLLEGTLYRPTTPYRGLLTGNLSSNLVAHTDTPTNNLQLPPDLGDPEREGDQVMHPTYTQLASSLELSKNFKPHKYVDRFKIPRILVTAFYQRSCSYNAHINCYRILYFQSEERWINLSILLEIPRTSLYWDITQITWRRRAMLGLADPFCLPASLLGKLQKELEHGYVQINDNTQIELRLTDDGTCTKSKRTTASRSNSSHIISTNIKQRALITERELFGWIRHTDCPRYSETEVVPWAILELPDCFAVYLGHRLTQEVKSMEQNPSPTFCYNLQLLHSLRDVPEVVGLIGVTIDATQERIKSYLIEWPTSECQNLLQRASDSVFPWITIETWARRLIRAVHAVHSRFFVVGSFRGRRPPVLVDAFDNIYLHAFESGIQVSTIASPFYPPEYRQYTQLFAGVAIQIDEPLVTPAYDLYQLGQILWVLAESWATGQSALDLKDRFYKTPDTWPGGLYTGPDPLPRLSLKVPQYYRNIVESCSALDPYERLPCKDLLLMFPPSNNDVEQTTNTTISEPISMQSMRSCRISNAITCEYCRKHINSLMYKCTICQDSDFDMCSKCFDLGEHCQDSAHLLIEIALGEDFPTKTRYHSSVNQEGTRTIIEAE